MMRLEDADWAKSLSAAENPTPKNKGSERRGRLGKQLADL
jgi:hypothetical protein